jgi:hypothetical protein
LSRKKEGKMNSEEIDAVRAFLKKRVDAFEIYHVVERFEFYRGPGEGNDTHQHVTLEIHDLGTERPAVRYSCKAVSRGGREALGNPDTSVAMALDNVHWDDLDRDK